MTTRNQRQRKKLHLAEFQELGFLVNWQFAEGTSIETIDETVDRFIAEVIQPNGLAYEGSGYLHWEGLVCLEKIGKCDESHRQLVKKWLEENNATAMMPTSFSFSAKNNGVFPLSARASDFFFISSGTAT